MPGFLEEEELEAHRQALLQVIAEATRLHAAGLTADEAIEQPTLATSRAGQIARGKPPAPFGESTWSSMARFQKVDGATGFGIGAGRCVQHSAGVADLQVNGRDSEDGRWSSRTPMDRSRYRVGGVGFAVACAGSDPDAPLQLSFGHVGAPESPYAVSAEEFARRGDEQLGGRVQIQVFGSSQLGGDEVMLQKVTLGTLDLALPSTVMSSTVAEFGLFELPYLVQDREHMRRIESAVFWDRLAPLAERHGFTVLAVWENGLRHVTSNVRPVRVPEDLQGIKLRTPRGLWRVKMFQAYGANPSPMPLAEVFVALQTGVMDGQENPLTQVDSQQFQEVQQYLSLTGHVYTPAYLTAGSSRWSALPADLRAALTRVARGMQSYVHQAAARLDAELLEKLRGDGMQVNEIDRAAFRDASSPIYSEFAARVPAGSELVDAVLSIGGA